MKNPAPYLRRTLFDLLNGQISYNGLTVPVYENDDAHNVSLQIELGSYSDSSVSNKHIFRSNATQVIEVISEQPTGAKKIIDAVGELVMQRIKPHTRSDNLSGSDFQVFIQGKPSINHINDIGSASSKIVRLILTYNLIIIDKNSI